MKEKQFAKAIFAMILEEPEKHSEILKKAKDYLVKNGDLKLLRNIERRLAKLVDDFERAHTVSVVSGKKITKDEAEKIVSKHKAVFHGALKLEVEHDDSLIGGEVIEDSRMKLDNSYKRALLNIYQNTINSFL